MGPATGTSASPPPGGEDSWGDATGRNAVGALVNSVDENREHRWMQDELHRASNQILEEARDHNCTHVAFENLTDIRKRMAGAKRFHLWVFRRLYQYAEYKAGMFGIEVKQVSPAYTSQRCSSCGFTHEDNRRSKHQFMCQKCEYELNADYNASKNIVRQLLKRLYSGQTSSEAHPVSVR